MTTRPDGQMGIAAAFAGVTPRVNKRPRSEHVQDLVTPKPPPPSNENKEAKRKRDAERKRAKRAARSQEQKDADRVRNAELQRQKRAARSQEDKDADRKRCAESDTLNSNERGALPPAPRKPRRRHNKSRREPAVTQ